MGVTEDCPVFGLTVFTTKGVNVPGFTISGVSLTSVVKIGGVGKLNEINWQLENNKAHMTWIRKNLINFFIMRILNKQFCRFIDFHLYINH